MYFKPIESDKIVKRLKEITDQEKVYIENEVLVKIAEITGCDIRGSLSILEYICRSKNKTTQTPKVPFCLSRTYQQTEAELCQGLKYFNYRVLLIFDEPKPSKFLKEDCESEIIFVPSVEVGQ